MAAINEGPSASRSSLGGIDAGMLLAAEIQVENPRSRRFGFRIAGTGFLVPVGVTSEVIHQPRLFPLPWRVPCMRGLINVRGNVAPVFDLSPLLSPGAASPDTPYALIIDSGHKAVGLLTETLPVTLQCDADDSPPLHDLPPALAPFLRASLQGNRQRWFELDHLACMRALAAGEIPCS
jgi:chemotaxis signal transduction protein